MSNPFAPIVPKRYRLEPRRVVAAPIETRKARAGRPVLGEWTCSRHRRLVYRYARVGEVTGACHVKAAPGRKGAQPHEYMVCDGCGPALAICLTHSPEYAEKDRYFREASDGTAHQG